MLTWFSKNSTMTSSLPPQEHKPTDTDLSALKVPEESVFVPDSEAQFYFFHRMAKELPALLAERATVFISVAHAQVDEVLELIRGYEAWPEPNTVLSRTIAAEEDGRPASVPERLFFNPSGLIEYQF